MLAATTSQVSLLLASLAASALAGGGLLLFFVAIVAGKATRSRFFTRTWLQGPQPMFLSKLEWFFYSSNLSISAYYRAKGPPCFVALLP